MISYRCKFEVPFMDGNIFDHMIKAGEVLVLDAMTYQRVLQSGASLLDVQEVVPNPFKIVKEEVVAEPIPEIVKPEEQAIATPVKRKAGRPRKNAS